MVIVGLGLTATSLIVSCISNIELCNELWGLSFLGEDGQCLGKFVKLFEAEVVALCFFEKLCIFVILQ